MEIYSVKNYYFQASLKLRLSLMSFNERDVSRKLCVEFLGKFLGVKRVQAAMQILLIIPVSLPSWKKVIYIYQPFCSPVGDTYVSMNILYCRK